MRAAILKICPKHPPVFEVALNTGMRQGEQFRLTWNHIDLDFRTIFLGTRRTGRTALSI